MNIQEAKEEIIRSVRAYTAKDETGCYRIPVVAQRPILLMGPPGIGKTAVVEQAASECGVGILSYTITHHTRQSAVGLPQLVQRTFEGREYTATEYTLSEIVGAIYAYMERTGYREGILFIDEINCVSETLAPTMLQFLQYKTFGNHKVPEGWIIVAAGNPPEFNRAVRELDMASLDRVRTIEIEADFSIWKAYAERKRVHPAILSYLEMKPGHFYQVTQTQTKREFVTARGWEDLSVLLKEYERQGLETGRAFMEEFIRVPQIVADFASYYRMYQSAMGSYRIPELAAGSLGPEEEERLVSQLLQASPDLRCMFVRHLLAAVSEGMADYGSFRRYVVRKKEVLGQLSSYLKGQDAGTLQGFQADSFEKFFRQRSHALQVKKENGLLKPWEERLELLVDENLQGLLYEGEEESFAADGESSSLGLGKEEEELEKKRDRILWTMNRMTDFVLRVFGKDLELADWLQGLQNHGDYRYTGFSRPDLAGFLDQKNQEAALKKKILQLEGQYEADDCV